jgi:purine nucleosidase
MAEVWFGKTKEITFHDPLAAAAVFCPPLCGYRDGQVTVPLETGPNGAGRTLFAPAPDGPHRVAETVDAAAFFAEYFGVFR